MLAIDDNAEERCEDDITFTDGRCDGNGNERHCGGIRDPCDIIEDAQDCDGCRVGSEVREEAWQFSLDCEVGRADESKGGVDEPDDEDGRRCLACDAGCEVHDGHYDGAEASEDDTFFDDPAAIVLVGVVVGDMGAPCP